MWEGLWPASFSSPDLLGHPSGLLRSVTSARASRGFLTMNDIYRITQKEWAQDRTLHKLRSATEGGAYFPPDQGTLKRLKAAGDELMKSGRHVLYKGGRGKT